MRLYIYTLGKTLYEGECNVLTLPSEDGELSVLSRHAPVVTLLKNGAVLARCDSNQKTFRIASGFAQINQEQAILLVKEKADA